MNTAKEKTQKEGESENPDVLGVTQEADMFDRLDSSMNSDMQNTLRATVPALNFLFFFPSVVGGAAASCHESILTQIFGNSQIWPWTL